MGQRSSSALVMALVMALTVTLTSGSARSNVSAAVRAAKSPSSDEPPTDPRLSLRLPPRLSPRLPLRLSLRPVSLVPPAPPAALVLASLSPRTLRAPLGLAAATPRAPGAPGAPGAAQLLYRRGRCMTVELAWYALRASSSLSMGMRSWIARSSSAPRRETPSHPITSRSANRLRSKRSPAAASRIAYRSCLSGKTPPRRCGGGSVWGRYVRGTRRPMHVTGAAMSAHKTIPLARGLGGFSVC